VSFVRMVPGDQITQIFSILMRPVEVLPSLLAVELLPALMGSAVVLSLVIVGFAMWSQKLTPQQLFWLVTVLISIVFLVTTFFSQKYM
jgi:hypothetical protein